MFRSWYSTLFKDVISGPPKFDRQLGLKRGRKAKSPARRRTPLVLGVESLETRELLSGLTITPPSLANWTVSQPGYSQTINATGGTGSLTFSETGTLPTGLTLSSGGVISGTPTDTGDYTFTVTATDTASDSGSQSYTVTINPAVTITTTALPDWTAGTGYSQTISATGGTGSLTFSQTGTLPTGLTLSSGGVISGTPTNADSYAFTVTATDTVGASGSQSYTVTINPAVTITTTALPNWTAGTGYSQTINATGGTGTLTFSETGTLPTGLTLSSGGVISGTPTNADSYTFTVTATDTVGASGSQSYTVTINPAVTITTTTLANWTVNQPGYSQTINATGGTGSLTFSATGTLPTGLTLSSGGVISGTPTNAGSFTFTVTATDTVGASGSQSYTVTINPAVTITTTTLANWTVNQPGYSQTIDATGGTGSLTFSATGTLPTGLTLSSGGVISGTPTNADSYTFTVTATDTLGASGSQSYTVTINPVVTITTTALPDGTAGTSYSQTINATGGTGSLTFSQTGTLPTGLTLSSGGVISGTPTNADSYTFTVTATDTLGASGSQSYTVTINPVVTITTTALPDGTAGTSYSQTINATGGTGSLTFSQTGTLPTGLTLSSGGVISGTPTGTGTYTFTVTATDTLGDSGSQSYTVTINPAVTITTTTLANWTVNQPGYSQTIDATGGTGSLTFSATGTLPTGLTLSSGGVISGTPTNADSYTFTVTGTDTLGATGSQSYTVTINPVVTITTTALPNGTAGTGYSQTIDATGGTGSLTFSATGTLPTGLTLSSGGVISGTPTGTGTYTFTVTATDTANDSGSQSYTVTINPAVTITTTTLANWTVNQPGYSQIIDATGGTGSLTFSETGTLPTGLTLSSGGVISGTPTGTGTYTFTVTATDTANDSGSQSYTVTINPAVTITTTTLANWTVNQPGYSQIIDATGGTGSLTFSATGTLPTGLTLSSGGVISGTPTNADSYTFTVTGTDTLGATGSQSYTVTINPVVTITTTALPNGTAGTGYSQTIDATGGTGSLTFSETGTLPTGLTLSSGGVISGTPTGTGTYTFTVTATDTANDSGSQSYTVTINPAVTITTTTLANWTVNQPGYSQTIDATGGTGSLTFSATGTLPTGLTLSSGGVISGTPTNAGSYTFTVTATDTVGASGSQSYTVTINPAVTITTTTLANWTVNQPGYSQTIDATGGTGSLTFSATGTLPTGLTLSSGGVISGTPTNADSYTFTVTATDTLGASGSQSYTVTINPVVTITTTALPDGTAGTSYSQTINATGGTGSLTFSATGTLPTGLTLSSGGVISGTPTGTGTYTFTVTATDTANDSGSQSYTVTINPAVTITTTTLANWTVNQPGYSQTIDATGGTGSLTFSATGTLPTGLTLSSGGVISGTPTNAGSYTFTVTATDTVGASGSQSYTVTINPAVTITTTTLTSWTVNQPGYSQTIDATGGTGSLTFSETGTLPTGLTLSSGGVISGTPTNAGSYTFTVTATDTVGASGSQSYTVTINPAVTITTTTLTSWTVNQPGYSQTIDATGGTGSLTFSATGTLPTGLTLSSGGVISGTPTNADSYTFTVTATDTVGASGSQSYTVTINPAVTITTTTLANWTVNQPGYSQTIDATGGTGSLTFSATGTLPTGLTLSSGGVISGTPTNADSYTFTVTATDTVGASGSQSYTVTINPAVTITTTTLANWTVNQPGYSQTIDATDGTGSLTFSETGTLPTGLTLSSGGVISGTPTGTGTYTFTVTATDTVGDSGSQSYTVTINPAVTITTTTLASWTVNQPGYSQTIDATGGTGSLTFSQTGTLPTGLTLSSGGVVSGTPTGTGTYTFTVTATDTVGASGSQSYTVTINPAVTITTTALPDGTAGTGYSQTINATGGTGSLTFSETETLPTGLTLSSGGVISGTPTGIGTYTFTVTATDTVGASGSQSYSIAISPGPFSEYVVSVLGSSTVQAGSPILVTVQAADEFGNPVTSYSGPATATISTSPTTSGSTFPTTVAINSSGFGFFGGTLEKVGSYTITVAHSAFSGSTTSPVTVTPGPAVQLAFAVQPVNTPTGDVLPAVTVQVEDLYGNIVTSDDTDQVTLAIASGPGSFTTGSTTTETVANGVATFNNVTLVTPGNYKLSELVPTLYTGPNSTSFTVEPLQVVPGSFVGTPSGFSLQFNAPFLVNSTTPVLYGQGFGATAPVPSVTLAQTEDASGNPITPIPVPGSLVLNTTTNSLTFVTTDTTLQANKGSPILPDGTYTVILHSSAATDGFQALNSGGGFLDGLGSGTAGSGDFTATFTVNAAASGDDVVWVPATADGPGQALNTPGNNQVGGGYPIYLSDIPGAVTNVQVTLNYNPALLTVTGVTGAGFTLLGTSTPGQAVLQYSGPALPMGSQTPIGFITATVPAGTVADPTPYKAKDLLHLSNVALNGGAIPVTTSDALDLVAYVGDADGNGSYSSNDATLITRVLLETDTGFAAYPLVDPVIVADTDGDGFIPADAALQVNEAGAGFATSNLPTPPIPPGVNFQPIANNVDPTISLASALPVNADGTLAAAVNIDDAHPEGSTGLIEGHLALSYDPRQFSVSAADVHLGSVLTAGSGWSVVPTINPITGEIAIALSGNTPIGTGVGGSLVTIDFHWTGEPGGVSPRSPAPIELVASVNPTGQQVVTTELEDAQGTFTLTPAPTNGLDPRLDGIVTLTPTPASAVVSQPVMVATEALTAVTPVVAQVTESGTVNITVSETTVTTPVAAPEESEQAVIQNTAETGTLHVSAVHAAAAVVAATGSSITGLAFQFAITPAVNAQGSVGQHLADQFFQALVRGVADPNLLPLSDNFERVLPSRPAESPSMVDSLDNLNWDEFGTDLDWEGIDKLTTLVDRHNRPEVTINQIPPSTGPQAADRTALDQYFAQTTDYPDQLTDEAEGNDP